MTPRKKSPSENTPARPGGSTEEQIREIRAVSAECLKQLWPLYHEAKGFKIPSFTHVYDYRVSKEWKICREQIEKCVQRAAKSQKTYGERLRDLLRDKAAMIRQAEKDWPAFNVPIGQLFREILKIYNSAGDSQTLPPQRMGRKILDGSDGLKVDIQMRMARHKAEILKARNGPLKGFYAWRALAERGGVEALEATIEKAHLEKSGRESHGRLYDPKVARMVKKFGPKWWGSPQLQLMGVQFDDVEKVTMPDRWKKKFATWTEAINKNRKAAIEAIRRRCS
jgi:hypothetical protein